LSSSHRTTPAARMYQYAVFLKFVWNKTKICSYAVPTGCLAINITAYVVNVERKVQLIQFTFM